ncbi:P-loop NTPase fold protein [Vibrio fluvialis]
MSTELLKEQIKQFLSTRTPEVLAIKGDWGVGKTYCWEQHIEALKNECALKSYAYVSLFGINSIDALKQATFLNTIDTQKIGESIDIKASSKQWFDKLKSIKIPFIDNYISGFGDIFNSLSQLAVKDTIICFDDLERKSDGLSMKDFMGLVSFFKDRKNCKVVLLLNEDAGDETFEDYRKYKEKIVDRQLHFQPTAEESFDTMFENDFEFKEYVRDCCIGLNITNKRVITKIVNHTKDFLSLVDDFDEKIKKQGIHSSIVLSWCYYCHGADTDNIPEFSFVNRPGLRKEDESRGWTKAKTKRWDSLLNAYGYQLTDEIDLVVAQGIEQGFIDRENLISLCQLKQKEIDVENCNVKWDEAWKLFHGSFDTNERAVAEAMEAGMRDIVDSTSCSQYSSGLKVLRNLGYDQKADELIDVFIDARKGNPEVFNVDSITSNPFSIDDEKFIEKLREAYLALNPKPTVEAILQKRKGSNSYNMSEVEILNELSTDQIEEMFREFKGEELASNIRTFMLLASSNSELEGKIGAALDNIASTPLNKARMAKFRR